MKLRKAVILVLLLGTVMPAIFYIKEMSSRIKREIFSVNVMNVNSIKWNSTVYQFFGLAEKRSTLNQNSKEFNFTQFQLQIRKHVKHNLIILSTVDFFYLDLAYNLYYTSFAKFKISNYIIACTHHRACKELSKRNIK